MRVIGQSENIIKYVRKKNATKEFIRNKMELKGKILSVSKNNIVIRLPDGSEVSATSNIPLENFQGLDLTFLLLNTKEGLILRPKIDGLAAQLETNYKLESLLGKIGVLDNKENREILLDMIRQNIPITSEKFVKIREEITAFNAIKSLSQMDLSGITSDLESIEDMELKNIIKNFFGKNQGKNLESILSEIKNFKLDKSDIIFLVKNDVKINFENLKAFNDLLYNEDNLLTMSEKSNETLLSNGMKFDVLNTDYEMNNLKTHLDVNVDINQLLNENGEIDHEKLNTLKSKLTAFDSQALDDKIMDFFKGENVEEKISEILNKEESSLDNLQKSIKNLVKNIFIDKNWDINEFRENLLELKKSIQEILNDNMDSKDIKNLSSKLEILSQVNKDYMYFQIPFVNQTYKNLAEIMIREKVEERTRFSTKRSINIMVSIDTKNLDRVDSLISYYKNSLSVAFKFKNEKIKRIFESKDSIIKSFLNNLNFESVNTYYSVDENLDESLLKRIRYEDENSNYSTFDVWV
ncbi:MAG: hypothetical protein N4A54_09315 [Peptostreptococcaceae bacterium]|jgi:cell division protein ZapA (FtsZ GTPase activity inhibitor)|nr:hypothetical protein [Peptostreptococcaceae bacterium]